MSDVNMSDKTGDDIVTDEHDVLDNIDIGNMFPDLSLLQKELEEDWNECGDDSSLVVEHQSRQTKEETFQDHPREEITAHLHDENNTVDYENFFEESFNIKGPHVQLDDLGSYLKRSERFCGLCHILFSSRSEYEEHNIAVHLQDCLQDCLAALFEDKKEPPLDVAGNEQVSENAFFDKTELLCKPCDRLFKTVAALNFHHKIKKCIKKIPKVTDCSIAEKTGLLCKPCGKLFKTVASLNFHYKIGKCIKIKPKTTKCRPSLAEKKVRKSYVRKTEADKVVHPKSRVCSHCNTVFATDESLFDHMYEMDVEGSAIHLSMTPKMTTLKKEITNRNTKIKSTKCSFKKYKSNVCTKIESNSVKKINPRKNLIPKEKRFYYRCPVCVSYFARVEKLVDHLDMNNVVKTERTFEKVPFDIKCPHCQSIPKSFSSYKTHVIKSHRQELHEIYLKISQTLATGKNMKRNKKQASKKTKSVRTFKTRRNMNPTRSRTAQDSKKKVKARATFNTKGIKDVLTQKETKVSRDLIVQPNIAGGIFRNVQDDFSITDKDENVQENTSANVSYENNVNLKIYTENNAKPTSFILDSTLFRCNKCDVHFVSAGTAIDHQDHMELLIHWKCPKCCRIFKKEEEEAHVKQHLVSDMYQVHDLHLNGASDLSNILYKCVNCDVHFNDSNFVSHFSNCGRKQNSTYCQDCNIFLEELIYEIHEADHKEKYINLSDFIVVEAAILGKSNTFEDTQNAKSLGTKRKSTCNNNTRIETKKTKYDYLLNMCYCDTCQCFLTDSLKRNVHIESRCSHLQKLICKLCGLVLTPRTYQSHKYMHDRMKNLQLKHFRFRDLRSGKIISPPVPTFPKCNECDVHFPSKKACYRHKCTDDQFLTCSDCDKKFSEHAFKLHMAFHSFDELTKLESNDESSQTVHEDISINKMDDTFETSCGEMFPEQSHESNGTNDMKWRYETVIKTEEVSNSSQDIHSLTSNGIGNVIPKDIAKRHRTQTLHSDHSSYILGSGPIPSPNSEKCHQETVQTLELTLFKCKVCQITFDSYDKVVLHCQWHYSQCQKNKIASKTCSFCLNVFESSCFNYHENCHIDNPEQEIRLLQFDITYFRSDNSIWLNHLFGSLAKEQINEIIGNSIYKFECRIKMEVVQHGETELTVYKCERCQCFIDESSLYRHSENSCFKLRKHPCSYCGLPFIASLAKLNHEKLHENRYNISLQSYRMVVFNRIDDELSNDWLKSHINYIMYQCRNCNSVSDVCKWSYHKCSHDLKLCRKCGLLIENSEYESHTSKHHDLHDFVVSNMKVILYGTKLNQNAISDHTAEYQGIIKDYTFYKCNVCQTSFQTMCELEKHICSFESHQFKCPDCDLNVPSTKLKIHRKLHEMDIDFIKENIQIISTCKSTSTPKNPDHIYSNEL